MTKADIPEPTTPQTVTVYREPEDTRTECFQSPLWLDSLTQTASTDVGHAIDSTKASSQPPSEEKLSGVETGRGDSLNAKASLAGLPYVITPLTQGRPALSVTSRTATLSAVSPRNGQGLEFSYDIPQPNNRLSPYASAELLPSAAAMHTGLQYAHTWRDMPLFSSMTAEWSGGYGITTHGPGIVSGVTLTANWTW